MSKNELVVGVVGKGKSFKTNEFQKNSRFTLQDEGSIGYFLSEEQNKRMKDFVLELNRVSNQHLNKK